MTALHRSHGFAKKIYTWAWGPYRLMKGLEDNSIA